jgi:hypothetical protein
VDELDDPLPQFAMDQQKQRRLASGGQMMTGDPSPRFFFCKIKVYKIIKKFIKNIINLIN